MNMKQTIIKNLCYTELVYNRINKKLSLNYSKKEIEELVLEILKNTNSRDFAKQGKNYYISDSKHKIRLTINSYTCRIITTDKL